MKAQRQIAYRIQRDFDPELEQSVLGVCLIEPRAFSSVYSLLTDECFHVPEHLLVFKAIEEVWEHGAPVDLLTVARKLNDKGTAVIGGTHPADYLLRFTATVVSSAHLQHWCLLLRELAAKRMMIALQNNAYDEAMDVLEAAEEIQKALQKALEVRTTNDWIDASTAAIRLSDHMDEVQGQELIGISTTFASVDRENGGLRKGQLVVLGARPSVGKSALMGSIATQAARRGYKVGIISLEMPAQDIFGRMVSSESRVPFADIDRGRVQENAERTAVYNGMNQLAGLPIYFSDAAQVTIFDIRAKAEQLKRTHGLDMLIIDYLQLIEEVEGSRSREQAVSQISRGLKMIAMNLQIPVLALSQLNRESEHRANKQPSMADLRESGAIEQDADIIMLLHRDWRVGKYEDEQGNSTEHQADLLIPKWRNGTTMNLKLHFDAELMRFTEWQDNEWELRA
ncbi:MAG: replicative DNA helicase [Flavipsychrobacter sp.]